MKLFITRDQAKGFLGNVKFELRARVQLTNEEAELVEKYKVRREVLMQKRELLTENLFISSLTAGQTFKCKNIAEILEYEKNVKEACEAFKNYLEVMKNFGGEEVIEYQ